MRRQVLSIILSAALALAPIPTQALAVSPTTSELDAAGAAEGADGAGSWHDDIRSMLDAGDYNEGEAIIAVAPNIDPDLVCSTGGFGNYTVTETLATGGDIYEKATGTSLPEAALKGAQDNGETVTASDVEVKSYLVSAPGMTTEQILNRLALDERVLDASPNYTYESDEGELPVDDGADEATTEDEGDASGQGEEALLSLATGGDAAVATQAVSSFVPSAATDVTASADATGLQWAYNKATKAFKGSFNALNVVSDPTWNTGATNSSGIVAVFDTGVDYTHPDLAGSIADMGVYVAVAGGTSHGYNATKETAEPMDDNGHGTHVAGIIAAAANDYGVSGAANGAKLLPVKVGDSKGRFTSANIQRGYAYLKKIAQAGADLRVVNNSWSGQFKDPAVSLAVSDLGDLGVVSVFASGNNGLNIDGKNFTATGLAYNQTAVVVDSLNMDGSYSGFSNLGSSTDLFAPGSSIISTTRTSASGTYIPSAMRASSSTFVTYSGASSVAAATEKGRALGSVDAAHGFDSEGGCLQITGTELNAARSTAADSSAKKRVVLQVPVDESKLSQASAVGCSLNFTGRTSTNAWLEVLDSSGYWLWDTEARTVLDAGNWGTVSLDLGRACKAHDRQIALFHDASGRAYIKVAVCLSAASVPKTTGGLRIDCVGVGSTTWHYAFMSGTSMAAPAVSGLVAILTSRIPGYTKLEVSARAWKACNILLKSTRKVGALSELCRAGGVVAPSNFSSAITADSSPYIGKITSKDADDGSYTTFTIYGIGFGSQVGTAYLSAIGGTGATFTSWSDSKIAMRVPLKKTSGKIDVSVTNSSGKTSDVASTSTLGGRDEPAGPDGPSEPDEPTDPTDPKDPEDPEAPSNPDKPTGPANHESTTTPASGTPKEVRKPAGTLPLTNDASLPLAPAIACGVIGIVLVTAAAVARHRKQ